MSLESLPEALQAARQALAEKRPDEAISLLREASQRLPKSAEAMSLLGAAYAEKKDFFQALSFFEQSVAIEPSARGWFNVATLHKMQNSPSLARTALERALALDPAYERAKQMLAHLGPAAPQARQEPTLLASGPAVASPQGSPYTPDLTAAAPVAPTQAVQPPTPMGPQYPQMGDPFSQPQPMPTQARARLEEHIIWWRVIVGGIMVGLPSLLMWGGWTNTLSIGLPTAAAAVIALGIVIAINRWLAANVGDIEIWHWIILFFLTGLILAFLIIKGYELIFSGWFASKKVGG